MFACKEIKIIITQWAPLVKQSGRNINSEAGQGGGGGAFKAPRWCSRTQENAYVLLLLSGRGIRYIRDTNPAGYNANSIIVIVRRDTDDIKTTGDNESNVQNYVERISVDKYIITDNSSLYKSHTSLGGVRTKVARSRGHWYYYI